MAHTQRKRERERERERESKVLIHSNVPFILFSTAEFETKSLTYTITQMNTKFIFNKYNIQHDYSCCLSSLLKIKYIR